MVRLRVNRTPMSMTRLVLILSLVFVGIGCSTEEPLVDTNANSLVDITSKDQFDSEIKTGVSMVFYHASWCTKCAAQRPAVETVSEEAKFTNVFFAEVEYEDFSDIVKARGVNGFPTIVIYKDDVEIKRFAGQGHSEEQIRTALEDAIK